MASTGDDTTSAGGAGDEHCFPSSLAEFGFCWTKVDQDCNNENNSDDSLQLVQRSAACEDDGKTPPHYGSMSGFQFSVSPDQTYNQARYEALGHVITEEIYSMLEQRTGLLRVSLTDCCENGQATSFIFCSVGWQYASRLLLLIHGSGVVRAGQWSRRLIINNGITPGSQLPYIRQALAAGFGVIVLNTNHNHGPGTKAKLPGSGCPLEHALSVWDRFVIAKARCDASVAIVAHSYGGVVVAELAQLRSVQISARVQAVALTDSVHSSSQAIQCMIGDWWNRVACNWVASGEPLNTPLPHGKDCLRVSAGDKRHEWTSHAAISAVFDFINDKMPQTLQTSSA